MEVWLTSRELSRCVEGNSRVARLIDCLGHGQTWDYSWDEKHYTSRWARQTIDYGDLKHSLHM